MEWPSWWSFISTDLEFTPISLLQSTYLPTGITALDSCHRGGLIPGNLYEISGEAGTGKTNLALEILKNFSATSKGYYLSTQKPLSESRLISIGFDINKLYIRHSTSIEQSFYYLYEEIPKILEAVNDISILVLDNIYSLVQEMDCDDNKKKNSLCCGLAIVLKYLSGKYNMAVIVINNVVSDMQGGITPCLGVNWSNCINHRWFIVKKNNQRVLKITQTNAGCLGKEFIMVIDESSVQVVPKDN